MDEYQMENQLNLSTTKLEEEKILLHTTETNLKELRRQQLLTAFECREKDKLLIRAITSLENVQKNSLVTAFEKNAVTFNNKCKNVLKDYALLERAENEMQANTLHRFVDLPNILREESITNMTIEIDKELNDVYDAYEKKVNKFTDIKDKYDRLKIDRKLQTKNLSSLIMSIKKLTFQREIERSGRLLVSNN